MKTRYFPKRAVHLDFHTMAGVYDVGSDFDAEEFATTLKNAGVDSVNVFARCCQGFAYYPTKFGTVHPGLKIDLLGQMVAACHKHNIKVVAYFNAGSDEEHVLRRREWCKVDRDGYEYDYRRKEHVFRAPCLNTGYRDYTLSMIGEVLDRYPVDGLFLDYFVMSPCYGVECLEGMKKLGLDASDDRQAKNYCRIVTDHFMDEVKKLVAEKAGDINVFFNCLPFRKQPTHIEIEFLPTGGWGYDFLPGVIRYVRTLGKPFLTMTGRFHENWGDFGGLRQEQSLLFDCYNSISNGGRCCIGDHLHPRGRLEPAVYDLIGKAYGRLKELDPWTQESTALAEIVVIEPALALWPEMPFDSSGFSSLFGVSRMLMELKYQFDVGDGKGDISRYKVVVLPDHVLIDDELKQKLQTHVEKGGSIISSSESGLDPEKRGFSLKDYTLGYDGPEPLDRSFFKAKAEVSQDLPAMLTAIYHPGVAIKAGKGGQTLAELYQPYFTRKSLEGYHENIYLPPEKDTGRPAVVQMENIIHFSFPVFSGYYEHAMIEYKTLVKNCMARVFPEPLLRVENMPSFGQATVTAEGQRRMVHLLTYVPELRGKRMNVIEEAIEIRDVGLSLRIDGQSVRKVYLAPSRQELEFKADANYVQVLVPAVKGYQMIVFE